MEEFSNLTCLILLVFLRVNGALVEAGNQARGVTFCAYVAQATVGQLEPNLF
jgi:hypothetical protein